MTEKTKESNVNLYEKLDKFGKFQTLQYILICLPLLFISMMNVNYIFVAGDVNYRCVVPECETSGDLQTSRPTWWPDDVEHKCSQPIVDTSDIYSYNGTCTNLTFTKQVRECQQWIYESNDTIVSELNLACQLWKSTLVGSVHNAGMIVSMILMGCLSDRLGRKPALMICSLGGIVGVIKPFLTSYYIYLAVEFLESILSSGIITVAIVMMIETGGQTKLVIAGVIFSYSVYVGEVTFAFAAMLVPYWKHLIFMTYIPNILFISYIFLLRESTRWQMIKGKFYEAKSTLCLIAKMNQVQVTTEEIMELKDEEIKINFNVETKKDQVTIKDILASTEILRRVGVVSFCFFAAGFIYYGLTIHSVLLPGNKYINFILASITSFPGDLSAYFAFNKYGRRISLMFGFITCGVFCLAQAFSPENIPWLKVFLFLCSKFAVAVCFTGMYTYSAELFPTCVRGSLIGFCNTSSRVGSMLAPLTPLLSSELSTLPAILFSASSIIAGFLLTFTPETKELPLFDTIEQMEKAKNKIVTTL